MTMDLDDAVVILTLLDDSAGFVRNETEDARVARAQRLVDLLPEVPGDWALTWVRDTIRGGKVPTPPEISVAWRAEARARWDAATTDHLLPGLPEGVELGTPEARAWQLAYRRAAFAGVDPAQVTAVADRAIGATRPVAEIGSGVAEAAQATIRARLTEWAERQAAEQAALLASIDDEGDLS